MNRTWSLLAMVFAICLAGCQGRNANGPAEVLLANLDQSQALNYRVQWQQNLGLSGDETLNALEVLDGAVIAMESDNIITLIEPDTGEIRWRKRIGGRGERLRRPVIMGDHLFVCSASRAVAVRLDNGSIANAFDLKRTASTSPLPYRDMLIFGTPEGLIFAQHAESGLVLWEYQMAAPIDVQPRPMLDLVFVADSSGQVAVINPLGGRLVWRTARPPWGPIDAQPVTSDRLAYVASRDQNVYAFGRTSPDVAWRYLTQNPLTRSPMLVGGRVYQPTRELGLLCLDAESGEKLWNADLPGSPVQRHRDRLWLTEPGKVHIAEDGALVETVELPQADMIRFDAQRNGRLYLASRDGRVMRLAPSR